MKMLWWIYALVGTLFFSACTSSQPVFERSRSEYEYVPPTLRPTLEPLSAPVLPPVTPQKASQKASVQSDVALESELLLDSEELDGEKSSSFFGRFFGRNRSEDTSDIERVGGGIVDPNAGAGDAQAEPAQPTDNVYRLRVGDDLFITLSGSGGLNEQIETKIDADGNIKLRFIGTVKAKDMSSTELEREIKAEYTERQKIYRDITVRVVVPNTFYFIGGEVRQPGRFPMIGRVTLSQAIVAAGNFTEWANNRRIVLVRNNERAVINFREIMRDPTLDVELLAGDVVTVERSTF